MEKYSFIILLLLVFNSHNTMAQSPKIEDTEFTDTGSVLLQLRLHNGLTTNFKSRPDLYVGGVQLAAYVTPKSLVHVMRVGILADGFYTDKKLQAAVGPTIAIKLKTFKSDPLGRFGSVGNIHLSADH
ncbi:MAG: hypothetical protein ABIN97_18495, partial [Ginsengibacter sp.]